MSIQLSNRLHCETHEFLIMHGESMHTHGDQTLVWREFKHTALRPDTQYKLYAVATSVAYVYDPMTFITVARISRALLTMAKVAALYKYTWWRDADLKPGSPAYEKSNKEMHQRAATIILNLLETNKGLYIKKLQNCAPTMPFSTVEQILHEELHCSDYHEVFSEFDVVPIASASLAQVHRAVLRETGDVVAVKVQFPTLQRDFYADMLIHRIVLTMAGYFFKEFDFEWIHPEIEQNLRLELDFYNEGKNAEQTALNFLNDAHIYVPRIHWKQTATRILTMEFIDGVKITDKKAIQAMPLSNGDICFSALNAMAEMIFQHGFVHCDPHPGNLMVRRHPNPSYNGDYQVVILDHGLYRTMEEKTRVDYCRLWHSLVMRDEANVESIAAELGVVENWELFAMAVLMRPFGGSIIGFGSPVNKTDVRKAHKKYQLDRGAWSRMLKTMPRELVLVMRNQNYIRSLVHEMGYPVNRFRVLARAAVRGMHMRDPGDMFGNGWQWRNIVQATRFGLDRVWFEWQLVVADVTSWLTYVYLTAIAPQILAELEKDRFQSQ